jgi:putative membrane protein
METTTREKSKSTNWLINIIKGMIMALGFILPGVSAGVIAASLGLYERLLKFLANFRENFKTDFLFFLPVGIGGIIGIGLFSKPIDFLLANYQLIVLWGFAGAIIGTLPSIIKESTKRDKRTRKDVIAFLIALIIGFIVLYSFEMFIGTVPENFIGFIIAGIVIAFGIFIPGLSTANLLIVIGIYDAILAGFGRFDFVGVFLPIAIGGILGMLLFAKSMEWLIDNKHSIFYHVVLALVIVSTILIVIPPIADYSSFNVMTLLLMFLASIVGFTLGRLMDKLKVEK